MLKGRQQRDAEVDLGFAIDLIPPTGYDAALVADVDHFDVIRDKRVDGHALLVERIFNAEVGPREPADREPVDGVPWELDSAEVELILRHFDDARMLCRLVENGDREKSPHGAQRCPSRTGDDVIGGIILEVFVEVIVARESDIDVTTPDDLVGGRGTSLSSTNRIGVDW